MSVTFIEVTLNREQTVYEVIRNKYSNMSRENIYSHDGKSNDGDRP